MRVVIRVDASLRIGSGHVMRCLTLADALKKQGDKVEFICRTHEGNLIERIEQQGFRTHKLPQITKDIKASDILESEDLYGIQWLGSTQQNDAELCKPILDSIGPDWLIIDHYAIDQNWQASLKQSYKQLMVIDDLADRKHLCDLLLDQTYSRSREDYADYVPKNCQMLLGSQYALLRPEFPQWRGYSLKRRVNPELKKLLITMGGVDLDNMTGEVLEELKKCDLPKELEITVVMGETAPNIVSVKKQIKMMPFKTQVKTNVDNMAEIMANADLAIGAAGSTTWERCCLGLPSIQIVLAKNQKIIAELIAKASAVLCIDVKELGQLCKQISTVKNTSKSLIASSSKITDGTGVNQVLRYLK